MSGGGVNRQPARPVRVAAPRFPAGMREAVAWDRDVRSYDDLMRAYAVKHALMGCITNQLDKIEVDPRTVR